MDVRQLAALTAVADHGTFSAAASALGTVQSNVSAHIARLEREVGVVLVDRSRGRLTEEGEVVVGRARRIMSELEAIVVDVAAISHDVSGTARLGMIGTTARWLAPRLLAMTAEQHPSVRITVGEGSSIALEAQLLAGRLDLAVTTYPVTDADLYAERLFDEDLVLVVPSTHPDSHRGQIDLDELRDLPLLLPMEGTALREELDRAVRAAGFCLTPKAELDGVRLIASLTFEGHGPAVLPASAVPGYLGEHWVRLLVRGLPRRQVGLAHRRRGLPSAPARAVRTLLSQVISEKLAESTHPVGLHAVSSSCEVLDAAPG
jgi:DNA-binding transcriptional LysR family regulator